MACAGRADFEAISIEAEPAAVQTGEDLITVLIKRHWLASFAVAVASGWVRGTSRELGALEAELSEKTYYAY
jgi:hypothetical protein